MNKKAALGIVMTIVIILISALLIFTITAKFVKNMSTSGQQIICRANVVGGWSVANKDTSQDNLWKKIAVNYVEGKVASSMIKHPLCTTIVEEIEVSDKEEKAIQELGVSLGKRIATCWKTFGEGKLKNTFAQNDDSENYYFSCYKFKVKSNIDSFDVDKLISPDGGVLWNYNLKGANIPEDIDKGKSKNSFLDYYYKYEAGNEDYLSYAGYVFWEGYGYISFAEEIKFNWWEHHDWDWDFSWNVLESYYKLSPDTDVPMKKLNSHEYYEIRYYSPLCTGADCPKENIYNNIKIVPLGIDDNKNSVEEIEAIGHSS